MSRFCLSRAGCSSGSRAFKTDVPKEFRARVLVRSLMPDHHCVHARKWEHRLNTLQRQESNTKIGHSTGQGRDTIGLCGGHSGDDEVGNRQDHAPADVRTLPSPLSHTVTGARTAENDVDIDVRQFVKQFPRHSCANVWMVAANEQRCPLLEQSDGAHTGLYGLLR